MTMSAGLEGLDPKARAHLAVFKRDLEQALPGMIAQVTLFGSRARGDAEEDSDYDVAVFITQRTDEGAAREIISELAFEHTLAGVYISPIVLPENFLDDPEKLTALGEDIVHQGIVLA